MTDVLPVQAIFGGTFDPVHKAHLELAQALGRALDFGPADVMRFLPAGQPWQKAGHITAARDRIAMLRAALAERPPVPWQVQIDEREIQRAGPSYTIDTLQELRRETGERTSLVLFIGADQLLRLDTWRHWRDLFSFAHVVVATRPGFDLALLPPVVADEWQARRCRCESMRERPAGGFSDLPDQHYDISATDIRTRLNAVAAHPAGTRSMLEELLPTSVLNYIETNKLYND